MQTISNAATTLNTIGSKDVSYHSVRASLKDRFCKTASRILARDAHWDATQIKEHECQHINQRKSTGLGCNMLSVNLAAHLYIKSVKSLGLNFRMHDWCPNVLPLFTALSLHSSCCQIADCGRG